MNLLGWHPRDDIPETSELMRQAYISLKRADKLVLDFIEEGVFPVKATQAGLYKITSTELIAHLRNIDKAYEKIGARPIKEVLHKIGVTAGRDKTTRYYIFPKLELLRLQWNKSICKVDWKEPYAEWEINEAVF